jgi:hypothetical protein
MELSKKTTILLTPELHARLTELARTEGTSLGELVRRAVVDCYGLVGTDERVAAARQLAAMELPVGPPARMKRESVPDPAELEG